MTFTSQVSTHKSLVHIVLYLSLFFELGMQALQLCTFRESFLAWGETLESSPLPWVSGIDAGVPAPVRILSKNGGTNFTPVEYTWIHTALRGRPPS